MSHGQDRSTVYAAAESREFLNNALEGKSNQWIREFAGLIDDRETLDFLNLYCGIYEERGRNFLDTHVAKQVIRSSATATTDEAFREGNVSQLKGAVGLTNNERQSKEALEIINERLTNEGAIVIIVGPPGSGKTTLLLDILRMWGVSTGGRIFSNVAWDGADERVETDREMLEAMANVKGPTVAGIDEGGQNLSGEGTDSKKASQWQDSLEMIRKREKNHGPHAKQGSVVTVAHYFERLSKKMRRLATLFVQKPSPNDKGAVRLYDSEGGKDEWEEIGDGFTGLTDTRETYNEHESSDFDVILEADDDDEDNGPSAEDVARDEATKTVLRLCQPWDDDEGMSYTDAADAVDYSPSWVGKKVRQWRDGDHRDLVAAPDGESA